MDMLRGSRAYQDSGYGHGTAQVTCGQRGQVQAGAPFLALGPFSTFILVTFKWWMGIMYLSHFIVLSHKTQSEPHTVVIAEDQDSYLSALSLIRCHLSTLD